MKAAPKHQFADGIYFNMIDKDYHGQNRLSSSGIQNILVSPATFWKESWFNPDFEEVEKPHYAIGKAYHCARLEPEKFMDRFARRPAKKDYEDNDCPITAADIKNELEHLGEPKTKSGETVLAAAHRLAMAGYPGSIWYLDLQKFEQELNGRTPIDAKVWDEIQRDMQFIADNPEVNQHLHGGIAEVSILWTDEHGNKCKARIDYLKYDKLVDFKTFDNGMRKVLAQCIADAFRFNRYYIQSYFYWMATEAIRTGNLDCYQFSAEDEYQVPEKLDGHTLIDSIVAKTSPLEVWYVFQEKNGVPNLLARKVNIMQPDRDAARTAYEQGITEEEVLKRSSAMLQRPSLIGMKAKVEIEYAKKLFNDCQEIWSKQPWQSLQPTGEIGDDDFPSFWLEQ